LGGFQAEAAIIILDDLYGQGYQVLADVAISTTRTQHSLLKSLGIDAAHY